jgi:hypothetical protein
MLAFVVMFISGSTCSWAVPVHVYFHIYVYGYVHIHGLGNFHVPVTIIGVIHQGYWKDTIILLFNRKEGQRDDRRRDSMRF